LQLFFLFILAAVTPAKLRLTPQEILQAVAAHKHITLREDVPEPSIHFESECSLEQFQDAVEPQWGFRPERISNVYIFDKNEIYLVDEVEYYGRLNRYMDDSLAHEFVHFLQVKYQGVDQMADDSLEADAVSVQTWFRDTYLK